MPRTRIEKLWLSGALAVALLIAVVGYFFVVGPQRSHTNEVKAQVADAQLQTTTLQSQIVSLTSQQKKMTAYRAALARARAALPTADDLSANPALLHSLQGAAHASGVSLSSLTVGDPTAVSTTTPADVTPTSTAASSSTAPSSSPAPSSSTTVGSAVTPPVASLYSVDLTANVSGSTAALVSFLTNLQYRLPRALFISGVTIGSQDSAGGSGNDGAESMSLVMSAYVRPPAATVAPTTTAVPDSSGSTTP